MKFNLSVLTTIIVYSLLIPSSLFSFGTYSEGWVTAKITQFESRGLLFDSFEGIMEVSSFEKTEKCEEEKDACFTVKKDVKPFSVRPENQEVVNLLNKSINQEILLNFRIHRITALALSSDTEILKAAPQKSELPQGMEEKKVVKKTGSKRNFSVSGKILQLEYQGTFIGTYEGLYFDDKRGKIHPFSITSPEMADYAWQAMSSNRTFNMGISVAYATGFRKSNYDLFEINYKEPAGGMSPVEKN